MSEQWIVIPKWDEFQHPDALRTGNIPWLKTFTRLLSDSSYLDLNAGERAVLHGIWLEYARARGQLSVGTRSIQGRLTLDTRSLSNRLSLRVTAQHIEALNHAGFIEFSASKPASTTASTLQAKTRREENKRPSTSKARATPPGDPYRFPCTECGVKVKTEREIRAHLDDVHWLEGDALDQAVAQAVRQAGGA